MKGGNSLVAYVQATAYACQVEGVSNSWVSVSELMIPLSC